MALLSKSCIYAIRATIYVAIEKQESDGFVSISKIAKEVHISGHFLTKIFQLLTNHGLLESYRGPNGGVKLIKEPKDVKLLEILEAVDGLGIFEDCALGLEGCGKYYPCPLHYQWAEQRESLYKLFEEADLESLAESVKTAGFRLRTLDINGLQEIGAN